MVLLLLLPQLRKALRASTYNGSAGRDGAQGEGGKGGVVLGHGFVDAEVLELAEAILLVNLNDG